MNSLKKKYFWWKYFWLKYFFGKGTSLSLPRPCPITHPLHSTPIPVIWSWGGDETNEGRTYGPDASTFCLFYNNRFFQKYFWQYYWWLKCIYWERFLTKIFLLNCFYGENILDKNIFSENIFGKIFLALPSNCPLSLAQPPLLLTPLISDFWRCVLRTKNEGLTDRTHTRIVSFIVLDKCCNKTNWSWSP